MSYGVWKKRGKGWSSIEIDGAGNHASYQWEDYSQRYGESLAKLLKKQARNLGIPCSLSLHMDDATDDFYFIRWAVSQLKRGWQMVECDTGCEHSLWISYIDDESLAKAKAALGALAEKTKPFRFKETFHFHHGRLPARGFPAASRPHRGYLGTGHGPSHEL